MKEGLTELFIFRMFHRILQFNSTTTEDLNIPTLSVLVRKLADPIHNGRLSRCQVRFYKGFLFDFMIRSETVVSFIMILFSLFIIKNFCVSSLHHKKTKICCAQGCHVLFRRSSLRCKNPVISFFPFLFFFSLFLWVVSPFSVAKTIFYISERK